MRGFLFAGAFALIASPVAFAEDKKAGPPTAAQIKKQIADAEALITEKKAGLADAEFLSKLCEEEYKMVKEGCQDHLKGIRKAAEAMTVAAKNFPGDAASLVARAVKDELAAEAARDAAKKQLQAATDEKEVAAIKEKLEALEARVKKAEKDRKWAQMLFESSEAEAKKLTDKAQDLVKQQQQKVDETLQKMQKTVAKVREDVTKAREELDKAERDLRKLKEQLKALEK